MLAGDHLKSASDLGVPLVGVGLFYREGYFRQQLDESDWQGERYPEIDPARLPLVLESADVSRRDRGRRRRARCRPRTGLARSRSAACRSTSSTPTSTATRIGRVRSPTGSTAATARHRLRQELVLGLGGVRALRRPRHRADGVPHERGAFCVPPARAAARARRGAGPLARQRDAAPPRVDRVHDAHARPRRKRDLRPGRSSQQNIAPLVARCGFSWDDFVALGRVEPDDDGFGLTPFALRTSSHANGVSALHGEVSRSMWHGLWPERPVDSVPIGSVTNGVHARTWISRGARRAARHRRGHGHARLRTRVRRSTTRRSGACSDTRARRSSTSCARAAYPARSTRRR